MKVAIVYDRVNKWGGAERLLLALHTIWPDAPLYTAVYDKQGAPWANIFDVRTSFLQHIPFVRRHHELLASFTPCAFESFSFDPYDVVISVTSAEAKGIITKPHTCHICYCLTPTRYLWSGYQSYIENPGLGIWDGLAGTILPRIVSPLREWDTRAAQRPDYYLAISNHVADRIKIYYNRKDEGVIYPPVDVLPRLPGSVASGYYLAVSRLVGYKRLDIIIDACNKLQLPLVIIGDGLDKSRLQSLAGPTIRFVTQYLTDAELAAYYGRCRALIITADEDFGITAVEAIALGVGVIGYSQSGISEVVMDGKTGILFGSQTTESLLRALKKFDTMHFDTIEQEKTTKKFTGDRFNKEMQLMVEKLYRQYQRHYQL